MGLKFTGVQACLKRMEEQLDIVKTERDSLTDKVNSSSCFSTSGHINRTPLSGHPLSNRTLINRTC